MKLLNHIIFSAAFIVLASVDTFSAEPTKSAIFPDGKIIGYFESQDRTFKITFTLKQTIKYGEVNKKNIGTYEVTNCRVTARPFGKALSQGNYIIYFDGAECCYDIRLRGDHLRMGSVWGKPYDVSCPTRILKDKTQWGERDQRSDGSIEMYIKVDDPFFSD